MIELLSFPFMQRALIAGVFLAILLSVLGVFVVLRKMSFFADGMAHASLAGIAIGILTSLNPLGIALITGVIFAGAIFLLEKKYKFTSDTLIGIIFTTGMALGVILISFSAGYQPELISFLFGNILTITQNELYLLLILGGLLFLGVARWFKSLTLFSLNEEMAYLSGVKTSLLQFAMYVGLTVTIVLGIKMLGIILVSALLIMPVASAKLHSHSFRSLLIQSVIISVIIMCAGIVVSYGFDLPTGPTVILCGTAAFALSILTKEVLQLGSKS